MQNPFSEQTRFFLFFGLLVFFWACDNTDADDQPRLRTYTASMITDRQASSGGSIFHMGNLPIRERGLVWAEHMNPGLDDYSVRSSSEGSVFSGIMTDLSPRTTYYFRSYVRTDEGVVFGNVLYFTTLPAKLNGVTDIDGNFYTTVMAGNREWMGRNLQVSRFRNGMMIPDMTNDNIGWRDTNGGARAKYMSDETGSQYGYLYNQAAVSSSAGLCPPGWSVPGDQEWAMLINAYGGMSQASGALRSTRRAPVPHPRWDQPNSGANNSSGFNALPGGYRVYYGDYAELGRLAAFWTHDAATGDASWGYSLGHTSNRVNRYGFANNSGLSVRCVRNLD